MYISSKPDYSIYLFISKKMIFPYNIEVEDITLSFHQITPCSVICLLQGSNIINLKSDIAIFDHVHKPSSLKPNSK